MACRLDKIKMALCLLFPLFCALSLRAQSTIAISASNIQGLDGTKLSTGTVCFQATDQNNNPIAFEVGGGGLVLTSSHCSPISNGVISTFSVPNPASTNPSGILYHITIVQNTRILADLLTVNLCKSGGACTFPYIFNFDTCFSSGACESNSAPKAAGYQFPEADLATHDIFYVDGDKYKTCNAALGAARATSLVIVPPRYTGTDCAVGGGKAIIDLRPPSGFTFQARGSFTNSRMHEYLQSLINGAMPSAEFAAVQPGLSTDALTGSMIVPDTSEVYGANGIAGYVRNNSPTTNAVGIYSQARCVVNGSSCWGLNQLVADTFNATGTTIQGDEIDLNVNNTNHSSGFPVNLSLAGYWTAQPTEAHALKINQPNSSPPGQYHYTQGIEIFRGATNGPGITLYGSSSATKGRFNSQAIYFEGVVNNVGNLANIFADPTGDLALIPAAGKNLIAGRGAGFVLSGSLSGAITHMPPSVAGTNTITDPAATGTLSLAVVEYCGATFGPTQNCAETMESLPIIVFGDLTLNKTTHQSITKLPFTAPTYACTGSDVTNSAGIVSFSRYDHTSVTITESSGGTSDHLRYQCIGY